eukprot:4917094-Lingulodinium_polyedra.AAC.1
MGLCDSAVHMQLEDADAINTGGTIAVWLSHGPAPGFLCAAEIVDGTWNTPRNCGSATVLSQHPAADSGHAGPANARTGQNGPVPVSSQSDS